MPEAASEGNTVRAGLTQHYSSPQRRYHTLDHIADCLGHLDTVRNLARDPDALELALWFHDVIHVAGARDNEERSVDYFRKLTGSMEPARAERICELIMATKHGLDEPVDDGGYMVDIDLAGFGASWDEFMRKGDALREEYIGQSDDDYYRGQVSFIQRLRNRTHFYRTEYFRQRFESTAQENLRRLLDLRAEQGYAATAPSASA